MMRSNCCSRICFISGCRESFSRRSPDKWGLNSSRLRYFALVRKKSSASGRAFFRARMTGLQSTMSPMDEKRIIRIFKGCRIETRIAGLKAEAQPLPDRRNDESRIPASHRCNRREFPPYSSVFYSCENPVSRNDVFPEVPLLFPDHISGSHLRSVGCRLTGKFYLRSEMPGYRHQKENLL